MAVSPSPYLPDPETPLNVRGQSSERLHRRSAGPSTCPYQGSFLPIGRLANVFEGFRRRPLGERSFRLRSTQEEQCPRREHVAEVGLGASELEHREGERNVREGVPVESRQRPQPGGDRRSPATSFIASSCSPAASGPNRLPRHRVIVGSGHAQIWQLMALGAVNGLSSAFFFPAAVGIVPQT